MNKFLKMISAACLIGAMSVLAGCGGGGDSGIVQQFIDGGIITSANDGQTASAAGGDKLFKFATGTYTYTITSFDSGDKIEFPAITVAANQVKPSVLNTDYTDGKVQITWSSSALQRTITVELTGVDPAKDAQLNNIDDFNTVFGPLTVKY